MSWAIALMRGVSVLLHDNAELAVDDADLDILGAGFAIHWHLGDQVIVFVGQEVVRDDLFRIGGFAHVVWSLRLERRRENSLDEMVV